MTLQKDVPSFEALDHLCLFRSLGALSYDFPNEEIVWRCNVCYCIDLFDAPVHDSASNRLIGLIDCRISNDLREILPSLFT